MAHFAGLPPCASAPCYHLGPGGEKEERAVIFRKAKGRARKVSKWLPAGPPTAAAAGVTRTDGRAGHPFRPVLDLRTTVLY